MDQLSVKIKDLYDISINSYEKVNIGSLTENHILNSDGEKFFLKKYRFKDESRVIETQNVKSFFAESGIPVVLPLKNKLGNTYFDFNNEYYTIFPFIKDKQLDKKDLDKKSIVSLGEMLASIHLAGKKSNLQIQKNYCGWDKDKALNKIELVKKEIEKKEKIDEFDNMALENILKKKKIISENNLVFDDFNLKCDHLIHGDYLIHNVFFNSNNEVSYVFDFEKADYSPRTDEIFRSIFYTFLDYKFNLKDLENAKIYLDAYLSVYPVSKEELIEGYKLYYLKSSHGVWIEYQYYVEKNNRVGKFMQNEFYRVENSISHFKEIEDFLI